MSTMPRRFGVPHPPDPTSAESNPDGSRFRERAHRATAEGRSPMGIVCPAIALLAIGLRPGSIGMVLLIGLLVVVVALVVSWIIAPRATLRLFVWIFFRLFYRLHIYGRENIPDQGPALLAGNHVSWLDGVLLLFVNRRIVRAMVYEGNFRSRIMQTLVRQWGAILVGAGPKMIVRAIRSGREALQRGDLVGMFPEGGVTRSGLMQSFKPGILKILEGTQAPVIPVYFDGLWGSIFSFERGKLFWKIPHRLPYPVYIHFGKPMKSIQDVHQVRQAVQELGAVAVEKRIEHQMSLPQSVIRACKKRRFGSKIADSSGADLTGGQLLMRALILRRLLRHRLLDDQQQYVGVLLPPSAGATVVNLALTLDRRVVVNLNYTVTSDIINECIRQAGIKRVLTSRKVMEKLELEIDAELVYLDDVKSQVSLSNKILSALGSYLVPSSLLATWLGVRRIDPQEVLTIIFTSGSTGIPKGVMLTHGNVRHNVDAVEQVIHIKPEDVILGILPFFHSFGFTVTLWGVLALNAKGTYHFNPLDARQVGKLCSRHKATILLSTPTFLRTYIRRCEAAELASLNTVVTGAERLPKDVADAFEAKFGVRPVEGYGTTELAPLVSVNVPPSRSIPSHQKDRKPGSVGRTVPGVAAKVIDLDHGQDLPPGKPGMLLIKGPNVMKGYLNQPDKTAEVLCDGWYTTGDVAIIDEEGFIHITGRESRFSKIGGEMVPHLKVEESLQDALGVDREDAPQVVVTAIPDLKKGERLIVLHTKLDRPASDLCAALKKQGLPNLFIPSTDSFLEVEELPLLGTGKLDLRKIKQLAEEKYAPDDEN